MPKKTWQQPWLYTETILIVAGVYVAAMALQLTVGPFKPANFAWPVNGITGGISLLIVFLLSRSKNNPFFRWLSGVPLAVTLTGALIIQAIIMGLTPQTGTGAAVSTPGVPELLGFTRMTVSWPFVMIYFFLILALFATVLNRLRTPRWRDYAFYLNHVGLLLLLFAAGLGSADMKRHVMYVEERSEYPEWRVYSENKDVLELPLAIQLNDFIMEEYPPQLAIINRHTGDVIPRDNPRYFQLGGKNNQTELGEWSIQVDTFLMDAVRTAHKTYRQVNMPGSCPAARVSISENASGKKHTGWVCCGNYAQLYMPVNLDDNHSLVMTRPEPKRFASDIEVFTESGKNIAATLEVNKPLSIGDWTIYQYGYDSEAGKASAYSSFELVYDPWVGGVYSGIILCALGSFCLFWTGNKKRKETEV